MLSVSKLLAFSPVQVTMANIDSVAVLTSSFCDNTPVRFESSSFTLQTAHDCYLLTSYGSSISSWKYYV